MDKPDIPPVVRIALAVLLNHIEPGLDNCKAVIKEWLDGKMEDESEAPDA